MSQQLVEAYWPAIKDLDVTWTGSTIKIKGDYDCPVCQKRHVSRAVHTMKASDLPNRQVYLLCRKNSQYIGLLPPRSCLLD